MLRQIKKHLLIFVVLAIPQLLLAASGDRRSWVLPNVNCAVMVERLALHGGTLNLPAAVPIVIESHLATAEDQFPVGNFPTSRSQRISIHMRRSCVLLEQELPGVHCREYYGNGSRAQWTPPEHGRWGQGSVGNLRPPAREEMWSGNLFWAAKSKPRPGTRFLARRGDRALILVMGYETGPDDWRKLGVQTEVATYLRVTNGEKVTLGRMEDQAVPPGPIQCIK